MTLKLLFRTSGGKAKSKELGLGHIFRSINLAKNFPHSIRHFLIEDYGGVESILKSKNFSRIHKLKLDLSLESDFLQTLSIIKKFNIDILIVDKYKTKKSYLKKLKKFVKVIYVSDLKSYDYPADLVINGFIGFKNQIIFNKYNSKTLLGPKYQILSSDFYKTKVSKKKYDLLVTFGGYDEKGLNELFLQIIKPFVGILKIKFITGPSSNNLKNNITIKNIDSKKFIIAKQTSNMAHDIASSKFGLCSGGITSYEFAVLKIPFGIICNEFHQLQTAKEWDNRNLAKNLGLISNQTPHRLNKWLEDIVKNKPQIYDSLSIDVHGAKRVASEILKMK
jgi:spore coat polysaccharide biosynthesis predicted glycosyltransferase SpsG